MSDRALATTQKQASTRVTPSISGVLQRKCACGNHTMSGECEECKKNKGMFQRAPLSPRGRGTEGEGVIPPIVHEVLRSPGQPLDAATRAYMEPRFGHDFSQVRVHTDAKAAESARAVNALAYTVGRDVVFGAGQYSPASAVGKRLLAHELTHIAQQSSVGSHVGLERLGDSEDRYEHEAEAIAVLVSTAGPSLTIGPPVSPIGTGAVAIMRTPEDKPGAEKAAVDPDAGVEDIKALEPVNHAKQPLSSEEENKIKEATHAAAPATAPSLSDGPQFVLHDTTSRVELDAKERKKVDDKFLKQWKEAHKEEPKEEEAKKELEKQKKSELQDVEAKARQKKEIEAYKGHERNERGPLDEAAAAWVPEVGKAIIARPQFFDPRRPAATQFERRSDIIDLEARERAFQKVWGATKPTEQQAALQASLAGLEVTPEENESEKEVTERAVREKKMTPQEVAAEQKKAKEELAKPLPAKSKRKPHIWTTGAWTIEKICDQLKKKKAEDLAVSEGKAKDLEAGCKTLERYFALREPRFGSTVNVEISKPAGTACSSDGTKVTLVALPPYTASQYQETALVYLRAALQVKKFPEVTTHFWLDRFDPSGHCDPRCFNLQHFYDEVAAKVGHKKGSLYGIEPKYGIRSGTHNVWWHPKVCGGNHP